MGQIEVYEWLKKQRVKSNKWFEVNEIIEGLKSNGNDQNLKKTIYKDLFRLSCRKDIEAKGIGLWNHKKLFRAYKRSNLSR